MIKVHINGQELPTFIDTGSSASLLKVSALKSLKVTTRSKGARSLVSASSNLLDVLEERDFYSRA